MTRRPHDTPLLLAQALSRWMPTETRFLLEPAVGVGALLRPFLSRMRAEDSAIVCVDIDADALRETRRSLTKSGVGARVVSCNGDFLSSNVQKRLRAVTREYDCIVLNPPYLGRVEELAELGPSKLFTPALGKLPPEALFFARAVELLAPSGRALGVLPASVIAGDRCAALRSQLAKLGAFLSIHELSPFTFQGIEAQVYLVVFERSASVPRIRLRNHRLRSPDELLVDVSQLASSTRLDYAFHAAAATYAQLVAERQDLNWTPLSALSEVWRGRSPATRDSEGVLHTSNYRNGFWTAPKCSVSRLGKVDGVRRSDLLVARVHRSALKTFGKCTSASRAPLSECVLRVRPIGALGHTELLFALRTLLSGDLGLDPLLVRGVGAKYVSTSALKDLLVPVDLAKRHSSRFHSYKDALACGDIRKMEQLELSSLRSLLRSLSCADG